MNFPRWLLRLVWIGLPLGVLGIILIACAIDYVGVPPRLLGPYIERRGAGHNDVIVNVSRWMSRTLIALDRGLDSKDWLSGLRIGAQSDRTPPQLPATGLSVTTADDALKAIRRAQPGDVIIFAPGTYRFTKPVTTFTQGSEAARIVVRAERLGTVHIEFATAEGFVISHSHWTFENLDIHGVCANHNGCDHAFHVVGGGSHFVARNNVITDFNAHIKVNGQNGSFPDYGLVEHNTLTNTSVRQTTNSVTPVDIVAASHWIIRQNVIADFAKAFSDQISYGAFVKGGGVANRIEQNVILCETRLKTIPGQRVGLSLGGGGTGPQFCRDKRCITEQERSVIQSNLIAHCSDDGIYLNKAAASRVIHNTLIDTAGIDIRFAESSADVHGNLIDGPVRQRDGALVHAKDNYETPLFKLFMGMHPVRDLYQNPIGPRLSWKQNPPRSRSAEKILDLCSAQRPPYPVYGAFEDFAACERVPY